MPLLVPAEIGDDHDDHLDLSFASTSHWLDLPFPESSGGYISLMLLGDDVDGPFAVLGSTTPTDMDSPRGPAHGHESDSWRITLIGSSPMGNESYGPGEFRWQTGGRPYGADGYASGPTGGFHMVLFGDRRGFATQPVKEHLVPVFEARDRSVAERFGIEIPDAYPADARGVATSIGEPDKAGKVNGSFDDADAWTELAPGVRASWGVMGHRSVGPLIVLVRGAAAVEMPWAMTLATDVVVMVVAGSVEAGGRSYRQGDIRVTKPDATTPSLTAGPGGADVCIIVADRSALAGSDAPLAVLLGDLASA